MEVKHFALYFYLQQLKKQMFYIHSRQMALTLPTVCFIIAWYNAQESNDTFKQIGEDQKCWLSNPTNTLWQERE